MQGCKRARKNSACGAGLKHPSVKQERRNAMAISRLSSRDVARGSGR
ncbi:MAG: hypothetical protein ACTTH5_07520 [Wolinella sp.]